MRLINLKCDSCDTISEIKCDGDNPLICPWCRDVDCFSETGSELCGRCNGSGEGYADGTKCIKCKGSGINEEYGPTPWCHVCGSMTSKNCDC